MEMCKKSMSSKVFEFLSNHIIEVEMTKGNLIEKYYKDRTEESIDIEDFFREYSNSINTFLGTAETYEDKNCLCPIVIIGSTVEVQDIDDMETYQYRIVFPYSSNSDKSIESASCMSPLGKALLFNKIGQQVNIKIPAGTLRYLIKNVTIDEAT
jgi:transcription elongation factor GreA